MSVAAIWLFIVVAGLTGWYATGLPDLDTAIAGTRQPAVTVLAADGSELATAGDLFGVPVQIDALPPAVPAAVLAIEDRRFYRHWGVDLRGLARAALVNLRAGAVVQGGSTITQQVAKNLFLSPARTLERKVQEVLLALWLERRFTKEQILALYLNRVYYGAGAYGVDAAARKFFGVPASRLSTYQAAVLAGLLRAPSRNNPHADPDRADRRARQVLNAMVEAGFLGEADAQAAYAQKGQRVATRAPRAGNRWFVDWVLDQLPEFVSTADRDLVVSTTLIPRVQGAAEQEVRATLAGPGARARVGQAALVALSPDGAVRAMVGGGDYGQSQFNRAVQARRQPGSAFKPIVYAAALEAGLTPESRFIDAPVEIDGWRPDNFSGRYTGPVTLREALAQSINTVAATVAEQVGRDRVIAVARRLGLSGVLPKTPSLALGAAETSVIELTAAYAAFANGGFGAWPYGITAIHDREGRELYRRTGAGPGRVLDRSGAAAMTRMLASAVTTGTGHAARLDRPVAGKTGTSQNHRDAWFVGFTAELVTGVWLGNDDGTPMRRVTGGGLPARLWRAFMANAVAGEPVRGFASLASPPQARQPAAERSLVDRVREALADPGR